MNALVIVFFLLSIVSMICGIVLLTKKTDWKEDCFSHIPHKSGISPAYFGKPMGKAFFVSSVFYFLGAILAFGGWLWLGFVAVLTGFIVFWVLFILLFKGTRSCFKTVKDWIGFD